MFVYTAYETHQQQQLKRIKKKWTKQTKFWWFSLLNCHCLIHVIGMYSIRLILAPAHRSKSFNTIYEIYNVLVLCDV